MNRPKLFSELVVYRYYNIFDAPLLRSIALRMLLSILKNHLNSIVDHVFTIDNKQFSQTDYNSKLIIHVNIFVYTLLCISL